MEILCTLDIEEVNNLMLKYRQETDEFLICPGESEMLFKTFTGSEVHSEGAVSYSRILIFLPFSCWL